MLQSFITGFIVIVLLALGCIKALSYDANAMEVCQEQYSYDTCFQQLHN